LKEGKQEKGTRRADWKMLLWRQEYMNNRVGNFKYTKNESKQYVVKHMVVDLYDKQQAFERERSRSHSKSKKELGYMKNNSSNAGLL